jgi:hypothetical protein
MRNPVGPLPSSIYWRRRVVVLCLLALAAALVVWALTSRGSGGGNGAAAPTGSHTPIATITAGPAPSGTHISGRPGGRDTAPADGGGANGGPGDGGSGDAGTGGSDGGTGGTDNSGDTAGTSAGAGGSTAGDSGAPAGTSGPGGTSATGGQVPVGSSLPTCSASAVHLSLTSVRNSYSPDQAPRFTLTAANSGAVGCKLDFGPRSAVFTVSKTGQSDHVWASDDCPATGSYLLQVPAHGTTAFTLRWDGKNSSPHCASPKGQPAQPGTYLVQAKLPGFAAQQTSFVLSAD